MSDSGGVPFAFLAEQRRDKTSAPQTAPTGNASGALLLHHRLLGERLYVYALARFGVAGAMVAGALFARHVVGVEDLDVRGIVQVACVVLFYNLIAYHLIRRYPALNGVDHRLYRRLRMVMNATIVLDFIALTVALWLVGGTLSPFKAFYVINVIIAGVLLPLRTALLHTLFAYLLFAGLVVGEWRGWFPARYPLGGVPAQIAIEGRYAATVLAVQGLLMAVTTIFLTGLMQLLRKGERQLRAATDEVERYSEMQANFVKVALHDVSSPVSAASFFLQTLERGQVGELNEQQAHMVAGAQRRLSEVLRLVRDFQVLVSLDFASLAKQAATLDPAALVRDVVEENQTLAAIQKQTLELEESENLPPIRGIERLVKEAIANLVTNAIKYTPDGGHIAVRAFRRADAVRIEVRDNGIGIAPEDQKRLFNEFVRIRRTGVPTARRGGSGLGLSLVRRIVEMHDGSTGLESVLNEGSTFFVEFPIHAAGFSPIRVRAERL